MAESKILEREYVIPLRKAFLKAPRHERGRIAIRTVKRFVAKHMKVLERDLSKVKLDVLLNNEIWFRGKMSPPSKVKVKVSKENEIVKVTFAEMPEHVKFTKSKIDKMHKKIDKKKEAEAKPKAEESKVEKKEEQEKEQAVAEQHIKEAKQDAKAQKHLTKAKEESFHRMALKK